MHHLCINKLIRVSAALVAAMVILVHAPRSAAADLQAGNCELFIKRVFSAPGSHSTGSIGVIVKVGWIGNDEYIQRVGFHGYSQAEDLGNRPDCRSSPAYGGGWSLKDPSQDRYYVREWGEYYFSFPVRSGSVLSECPGYHYAWIGTFFVETNKNTYWFNPNLNPDELYWFDYNAFRIISHMRGTFSPINTDREDMRYYNPLGCR